MKKRLLSMLLAGAAVLLIGGSAMAQVTTPPVTGVFPLQIQATDAATVSQASWVADFVQDIEGRFTTVFGFQPSRPTTILLFPDEESLVARATQIIGSTLSVEERNVLTGGAAFFLPTLQATGEMGADQYVILVNMDTTAVAEGIAQANAEATAIMQKIGGTDAIFSISETPGLLTSEEWQHFIQRDIVRQYTMLMERDVAGGTGAMWFREGLVETVVSGFVPGTPREAVLPLATAFARQAGTLPTLGQLEDNETWMQMVSAGGETAATARGTAFLAASTILNRVGGPVALSMLREANAGQAFAFLLQHMAGLSLEDVNAEFQTRIPTL